MSASGQNRTKRHLGLRPLIPRKRTCGVVAMLLAHPFWTPAGADEAFRPQRSSSGRLALPEATGRRDFRKALTSSYDASDRNFIKRIRKSLK
jgi:hypothetical protein